MKKSMLYILLVLLALLFLFTVQNAAEVELDFLFWTFQMRRSLLVFLLLLIGTATGWILRGAFIRWRKARREKRTAKAEPPQKAAKDGPSAEQRGE